MSNFVTSLCKRAESMFSKRATLHSQWQEIAEQFYPERADFTVSRNLGDELTQGMSTSFPMICRRDLGNAISAMLRPRSQHWFAVTVEGYEELDSEGKEWLEGATRIFRRMLYDPDAMFVRATKECDHDYVTFGDGVISCEMNRKKQAFLFRNWHLRDVAWTESYDGSICEVFRRSKVSVDQLDAQFDGNISAKSKALLAKDPDALVTYYHVVLPKDRYKGELKANTEYVSVYIEGDNKHLLREEASQTMIYIIPRWQTVSGTQYANSPASVAALPDARMLQSMSLDILDAGERAVDPLIFARKEIFRGDINRSGGVQFIDLEPDQSVRDALEFAPTDTSGISRAFDLREDIKAGISKAFFLDRLNVPIPQGQGTAYEMALLNSEYIRNALPLFEAMEQNYNAPLCTAAFSVAFQNGAFTSLGEIPEALAGRNIEFKFESPIHEAIEKQKAQMVVESLNLTMQVAQVDQSVINIVKYDVALRDSFDGMKVPTKWLRDVEEVEAMKAEAEANAALQQQMATVAAGGQAAQQAGAGAQALQASGII